MALNKFMHPRNIYRTPPDFAQLAKEFEEFAKVTKKDVTGKTNIDFKDPHSLRMLTKYLLKSDFNLDVEIPEDRLVPTLPLRLNYILWIEDLLNGIKKIDGVKGLDIGTGACAVYPLLAAVKNKWKMTGTETDKESQEMAYKNVTRNNFEDLIDIKCNQGTTILKHVLEDEDSSFDFCMCNPPFYSSLQELCESRSPARLPPKNGFTGSPHELITDGGELAFCRKMIEESKLYKDKILFYTTMVGHKYNLKELVLDLIADDIKHTTTEFCQGRVTRWGLAWTYQDYDIASLIPGRDKPRKQTTPIVYSLPELPGSPYNIDEVTKKLYSIFKDLRIEYKILNKTGNKVTLDIKAASNTWSNQRRKRRQMKRLESNDAKKPKIEEGSGAMDQIQSGGDTVDSRSKIRVSTDTIQSTNKVIEETKNSITSDKNIADINNTTNNNCETNKNDKNIVEFNTSAESYSVNNKEEPIVYALTKITKKEQNFFLETEFLDGTAGKEGLHQIVQYIKNNWK